MRQMGNLAGVRFTPEPRVRLEIGKHLKALLEAARRRRIWSRDRDYLLNLEDRLLADIGLNREQVQLWGEKKSGADSESLPQTTGHDIDSLG